ncbi:TetR/AcrR family transcriptional regulator [Streptomyces desertarenae]|uniref:TetR/AcrR family transcriptional regulator n=1 Tax=Streptomyces desertarenae TaxID=2666184 RepID=A0ABW4PK33_9ACTN
MASGTPPSPRPPASTRAARTARPSGSSRAELIADTAIGLLAERGLRGLTHRAVDEAAGLPQGSTSNHARTREALLEAAVRRLADREAEILAPRRVPGPDAGPEAMARVVAEALHRYLTRHRRLAVARYELALEATRRPALRAVYDRAGTGAFREPLVAVMAAAGSAAPERHALSLIAWCEGMMFACAAGSHHSAVPDPEELRTGLGELLRGMLGG